MLSTAVVDTVLARGQPGLGAGASWWVTHAEPALAASGPGLWLGLLRWWQAHNRLHDDPPDD